MAQEMAARLGECQILLGAMPENDAAKRFKLIASDSIGRPITLLVLRDGVAVFLSHGGVPSCPPSNCEKFRAISLRELSGQAGIAAEPMLYLPTNEEFVMSAAAHQLLTAIDALPEAERDAVLTELLLSRPVGGDLPDAAFEDLAEELFLSYDAAEAADAAPR